MDDSHYDVAQICENGHVTNSMAQDYPDSNQDYCDKCGDPTIMACPSCQTAIRGNHHVPGIFGSEHYSAPAFCYKCGKPFPWISAGLRAAEDLADKLDDLTSDDRKSLKKVLPDLVLDTPSTPVAEAQYKKIMRKVGKGGCASMQSILMDIVSEVVRKTIFSPYP